MQIVVLQCPERLIDSSSSSKDRKQGMQLEVISKDRGLYTRVKSNLKPSKLNSLRIKRR
jgi:TusA-related sulfurtransferase